MVKFTPLFFLFILIMFVFSGCEFEVTEFKPPTNIAITVSNPLLVDEDFFVLPFNASTITFSAHVGGGGIVQ